MGLNTAQVGRSLSRLCKLLVCLDLCAIRDFETGLESIFLLIFALLWHWIIRGIRLDSIFVQRVIQSHRDKVDNDDNRVGHPVSYKRVPVPAILSLIDFPRSCTTERRSPSLCARARACQRVFLFYATHKGGSLNSWNRANRASTEVEGVFPSVKDDIYARQLMWMYHICIYMRYSIDTSSANLLLGTLQFACVKT